MSTRLITKLLAASFVAIISFDALPCSLDKRQLTVQFEPDSAELGVKNAKSLAQWFIQWRDGLGIDKITVVAPALKHGSALASRRMKNVAEIFDGINTKKSTIVYETELRDDGFPDTSYLNSLDANVQPACLKLETCCREYRQVD